MARYAALLAVFLLLAACTTQVRSNPARTATEELLVSTAAERAAQGLSLAIPDNRRVFIDAANFDTPDGKYAVSAIRDKLLKRKLLMVGKREEANVIVEVRSGALSTNQNETLVGIPAFSVPVPLASGALPIPELALYKKSDQEGVAQFSAVAFEAKSGKFLATAEPQFGYAHDMKQTVLFFVTWSSNDIYPKDETALLPSP